jgi:colicin import membrane protein
MRSNAALWWLCLGCMGAGAAMADDAAPERAERDRIRLERVQVEAAFNARETECRRRFVVTPCLDAARRARREAMEGLRRQEAVLDEAQRKQRAAQRIEDIRNKVSGDDAKRSDAQGRSARTQQRMSEAAARPASPASAAPMHARTPVAPNRASSAAGAERRIDYEKRQAAAQEHREAVERRNADHAKTGKRARPLPASGAASAL